jgi:hypothetical protein
MFHRLPRPFPVPKPMHVTPAEAIFWAAAALCALAQLALLHSFFLGASRPGREAAASFRATETLWAVVPAVVLVLLLAGSWRAMQGAEAGTPRVPGAAAVGGQP